MDSNDARVFVEVSKTQGRGLFASRDFRKGEMVLDWNPANKYLSEEELKNLSEEEKHYVAIYNGKYFLIAEPERYMNHSCDPNTETKNEGIDYALRDIGRGEEVTGDYEKLGALVGFECSCNSLNCRHFVRSRVC